MAHIETQLHGGFELVDVLPARSGRADELLLKLALVDRDVVGDPEHAVLRTRFTAESRAILAGGSSAGVAGRAACRDGVDRLDRPKGVGEAGAELLVPPLGAEIGRGRRQYLA